MYELFDMLQFFCETMLFIFCKIYEVNAWLHEEST